MLHAIALVIATSNGPSFVHHHPPKPDLSLHDDGDCGCSDSSEESTSETESSLDEEESDSLSFAGRTISSERSFHSSEHKQAESEAFEDEEVEDARGDAQPWERILGYDTDILANLLTPKTNACNRRFEACLDDLIFLGYPVHVRADGSWIKKRKKHRDDRGDNEDKEDGDGRNGTNDAGDDTSVPSRNEEKETHMGDGGQETSPMTMFHMVFIMSANAMDYQINVTEMYAYVVTRFTSALRFEQAECNYVWKEAETIGHLKEEAAKQGTLTSTLWNEIEQKSNLAEAMSTLFACLSANKTAHILVNRFVVSLQIPIVMQSSTLPIHDPDLPSNVYMSTLTSFGDHEDDSDTLITPHYSLLLLDSVDVILREIPAEATAPLAYFIRTVRPTQTFLQLSRSINLPLNDIQDFARHLIYWRRARAIPPIHPRNIYIVSPTADMSLVSSHSKMYRRQFPMLPSLARMLGMLSLKPRPFSLFIPSKDHRQAYVDMLIWLKQHGWTCQLLTFAWVQVSPEIQRAVGMAEGDDDSARGDEAIIISDPHRATAVERKWLEKIAETAGGEDVQALFARIVRYFNGKHALEKIPAREGIGRREVRKLIAKLDEHLVIARHW